MKDKLNRLREKTGMPLMQCKSALEECAGVEENAFLLLTLKPGSETDLIEGYQFDNWIDDLSNAIFRGIQKTLPSGDHLGIVKIELDDIGLWPLSVSFATLDNVFTFQPYGDWDSSTYHIPQTSDDTDTILNNFIYKHIRDPLFNAKNYSLYDWFKLPGAIWRYSLICIEADTKKQLLGSNIPKASDFDVLIATHGELVHKEKELLLSIIRSFVEENLFDETIMHDFADLCYASESSRQWLMNLHRGLAKATDY